VGIEDETGVGGLVDWIDGGVISRRVADVTETTIAGCEFRAGVVAEETSRLREKEGGFESESALHGGGCGTVVGEEPNHGCHDVRYSELDSCGEGGEALAP
jgi:hypothetical protein